VVGAAFVRSGRTLFAVLLGVYLLAGWWTTSHIAATGDETEYFAAADALIHGEGLELTGRFAVIAASSYAPGQPIGDAEFRNSTAPSLARAGRYPRHDVGLSLLIAPLLAIGGRGLVVAVIGAAMAGAVALTVRSASLLGATPRAAVCAGLAVGLAVPALTYSGQVFPDAVAPLAVALALAGVIGRAQPFATGLVIALLPFLHLRYWPLALGLLVLAAWPQRRSPRTLVLLSAPVVLLIPGLALLDLMIYGLAVPHAGFVLFFAGQEQSVTPYLHGTEGLVGLFLDRAFGLLPAAPILVLACIGLGAAPFNTRVRPLLLIAIAYLVPAALLDWTGAFSPQARYLAPLVPVLVLALAYAFDHAPRRLLVVAVPLAIWTLGQSLVYVVLPQLRYDVYALPPQADRAWLRLFGIAPSSVFPLFGTDGATAALTVAWGAALAALGGLGAMSSQRHRESPPSKR